MGVTAHPDCARTEISLTVQFPQGDRYIPKFGDGKGGSNGIGSVNQFRISQESFLARRFKVTDYFQRGGIPGYMGEEPSPGRVDFL
jgi:hypothetical protein